MNSLIQQIRAAGVELRPGLTAAQLAEFRVALGADLPSDLASLYVDHDGMLGTSNLPMRMLSCAEALRENTAVRAFDGQLLEPGACLFWTDDHSNYAGVFLSGPLVHRVFILDHDDPELTPRFFDVRSFTRHLLAHPDDVLGGDGYDYPAIEDPGPTAAEDRRLGREFLREHTESRQDQRTAFLALALLPPEDTHLAVPLLDSPDMWIQERACLLLGVRRHRAAIPRLVEVARSGLHNGRIAAVVALKRMATPEAESALHTLEGELGEGFRLYFRRASS